VINAWRPDIGILEGEKIPLPVLTMELIEEENN
jgi:hypothetical protein